MARIRRLTCVSLLLTIALVVFGGCSSKKVTPRPPFPSLSSYTPAAVFETSPSAIKLCV